MLLHQHVPCTLSIARPVPGNSCSSNLCDCRARASGLSECLFDLLGDRAGSECFSLACYCPIIVVVLSKLPGLVECGEGSGGGQGSRAGEEGSRAGAEGRGGGQGRRAGRREGRRAGEEGRGGGQGRGAGEEGRGGGQGRRAGEEEEGRGGGQGGGRGRGGGQGRRGGGGQGKEAGEEEGGGGQGRRGGGHGEEGRGGSTVSASFLVALKRCAVSPDSVCVSFSSRAATV